MQSGSPSSSLAAATDYQAQKANQKEERKLKRRIAEIEERLETIEARETEINEAMLTTNDFTQLADLDVYKRQSCLWVFHISLCMTV